MATRVHASQTEDDGAIRVQMQDNDQPILTLRMCQRIAYIELAAAAEMGDTEITLDTGHGVVANNVVCLRSGTRIYQAVALSVVGDVVSLDAPIDCDYPIGTGGFRSSEAINVNGSVTTQSFTVAAPEGVSIDVYGVGFIISNTVAMDDSTFGGLTALTKGVVLRKVDGEYRNIMNAKTNGGLALYCAELTYDDKAPAGTYSIHGKVNFPTQNGVAIRISDGESIELLVQDDLSGLSGFRAIVWGHIVE